MLTRQDFKNLKDMPQSSINVDMDRHFTKEEFNKIVIGIKSSNMDQRWNILFEDGLLHFYRSWTGHCIFIGHFDKKADETAILKKLTINGDSKQYNRTKLDTDINVVLSIIKSHLIDRAWG